MTLCATWIELILIFSIEFKYNELNFDSTKLTTNSIQSNNWIKIQFKQNGMQIGGEGIENMFVNIMLKNKLLKYTYPKRYLFVLVYLWMG